jgi:nicotinamidase-related amidase
VKADAELHDWHIEPYEYARQEARRGKRHAYSGLVPARTALIVIDMVPFFVEGNPYARGIVPVISLLADSLREAGGTVAWITPAAYERSPAELEFWGPDVAELHNGSGAGGIWPGLTVHDADLRAEKTAPSAFFPGKCPLPDLLTQRGIDTVLITGTVTNICCEASARDASAGGFRVIMVADANAARRDQDHNAALYSIYRAFGDVRPAAEILELW